MRKLTALLFSALSLLPCDSWSYGTKPSQSLDETGLMQAANHRVLAVWYVYDKLTREAREFDNHNECFPDREKHFNSTKESLRWWGFPNFNIYQKK